MVEIAPSILSADFTCLKTEIEKVKEAGIYMLHIDVMDGHFVPNITVGPMIVADIRDKFSIPLDVHLMISNPADFVDSFENAGANLITVHSEACVHLDRTLDKIRSLGIKSGVSLNPATPPELISWISDKVDIVLVMSVNPGFGGQKFIKSSLSKIKKLNEMRKKLKAEWKIQVDGGVNLKTAPMVIEAGADILVVGSAIFKGEKSPAEIIREIKLYK